MEWTNDIVLNLVREYRNHTMLWDSSSNYFKIKSRRDRAWEEIAQKLGTDVNEVKKKMNSVLASFRRERLKVLKSGNDFEETYESRWFAFESFKFLMDRAAHRPVDDIETVAENSYSIHDFDCATVIKSEIEEQPEELEILYSSHADENILTQEEPAPSQQEHEDRDTTCKKRRIITKRKCRYEDPRVSNLSKIVRKLSNEHENRDECKVFGEYLVHKLRNYEFRTRAIVQHLINNIIFNADMGKYQKSESSIFRKEDTPVRNGDCITDVLNDDKMVPQDIDYLQEITKIVSDGKHFLDVQ